MMPQNTPRRSGAPGARGGFAACAAPPAGGGPPAGRPSAPPPPPDKHKSPAPYTDTEGGFAMLFSY